MKYKVVVNRFDMIHFEPCEKENRYIGNDYVVKIDVINLDDDIVIEDCPLRVFSGEMIESDYRFIKRLVDDRPFAVFFSGVQRLNAELFARLFNTKENALEEQYQELYQRFIRQQETLSAASEA